MTAFYRSIKKALALPALLALLALLFCAPAPASTARAEDVLRLHILANSDSPADQAIKLRVRDAVIAALPPGESAAQTQEYLLSHGAELLALVERTLQQNGATYGAQLMLGTCAFPERTYAEKTYPAGDYDALRILLGNGDGQNWWCVLFPPLCIVTVEQEPLPETDELRFESSIVNWVRSWGEDQ